MWNVQIFKVSREALENKQDVFKASSLEQGRGEEPLVGTSTEVNLLGTFCCTKKPYLNGSGTSAWGVRVPPPLSGAGIKDINHLQWK
jgi:hypothetical protein